MAYTIKGAFDTFITEVVNLNSDRNARAKRSRDFLWDNLKSIANGDNIPTLYTDKMMYYGSFARHTKISPLDDIDMLVAYSGCGGTYEILQDGSEYKINMPRGVKVLSDLCDCGELNSRKVVENLKQRIAAVPQYKNADLHRNQEAVTVQLLSYEWNFDIVPCFYTTSNFYLIPNGNGRWKATNPIVDRDRLENANRQWNGRATTLIRLMKYWKRRKWCTQLGSYPFEQLVLSFIESHFGRVYQEDISIAVRDCLYYLANFITYPIWDPKGYQGDLNTLSIAERQQYSRIADNDYQKAVHAMSCMELNDMFSAFTAWRKIFGDDFPKYGRTSL